MIKPEQLIDELIINDPYDNYYCNIYAYYAGKYKNGVEAIDIEFFTTEISSKIQNIPTKELRELADFFIEIAKKVENDS